MTAINTDFRNDTYLIFPVISVWEKSW